MKPAFAPIVRQRLADRLARTIRGSIQSGRFKRGDQLPPIMELARRFQVGHPTIREALKKLESTGFVDIRHGAGVFVVSDIEVVNPEPGAVSVETTRKMLLDLVRARMALELQSVVDAARNATPKQIEEMRAQLGEANANLENDEQLNTANMSFHELLARASGNQVLVEVLCAMRELFSDEQRLLLGIGADRARDHAEHQAILASVERHDDALAEKLMQQHLEGVLELIANWQPGAPHKRDGFHATV